MTLQQENHTPWGAVIDGVGAPTNHTRLSTG